MPAKTPLARVRAIIRGLPETSEKVSHGAPTWWGGRKTFAMFHDGHYDESHHAKAVWVKAEDGVQQALIDTDPQTFYRPKYLGPAGWVGVRLSGKVDWARVEVLLLAGYRLVAPKRALHALDERAGSAPATAKRAANESDKKPAKTSMAAKMKNYASYAEWKKDQSARNKRLIGALERVVKAAAPHLTRTVKWGQGCFADGDAHKAFIHTEDDHVQFGFYAGNKLKDPKGLLVGNGKHVRHVKVFAAGDVQANALSAFVRQVVR